MTLSVMAGRDLIRRPGYGYAFLPEPPQAWYLLGSPACEGADPVVFFGPDHEAPHRRVTRVMEALSYCNRCPVTRQCLNGARDRQEKFGVWGGVDIEAERKSRPVKTVWQPELTREAGQ